MDTNNITEWNYKQEDISKQYLFFNILKTGQIHVLPPNTPDTIKIPPSNDVTTGVRISEDVSARVFLPKSRDQKLPVLLYVHGGAFCMGSAFSVEYTCFLTSVASNSSVVCVSVEYGLFPTCDISVCYDHPWIALEWLGRHGDPNFDQDVLDPWIKDHADTTRIFIGGDSAGGNIAHTVLVRETKYGLPGVAKVEGMILIHPYFGGDNEMWMYMCPNNEGPKDPRMTPATDDLAKLACKRVVVIIGEKDELRGAGLMYAEELRKSGWKGSVELVENVDKEHCFHLSNYLDEETIAINEVIKGFINRG